MKGAVFWCYRCKVGFSTTDKNGVATCPSCGHKRVDGLNPLKNECLLCMVCGCIFSELLQKEQAICPNGCNCNGGIV